MRRWSYSAVMATIAVFIALGGTTYAALTLPANSVGTKQIRNKAITFRKLDPAAVKRIGADSGAIVVRARSVGATRLQGGGDTTTQIPLTRASWRQLATEVDQLAGRVTYTYGPSGSCGDRPGSIGDDVAIFVNGEQVGISNLYPTAQTQGIDFHPLFEPGASTKRTLTAKVANGCAAGQFLTVKSLAVDVIASR